MGPGNATERHHRHSTTAPLHTGVLSYAVEEEYNTMCTSAEGVWSVQGRHGGEYRAFLLPKQIHPTHMQYPVTATQHTTRTSLIMERHRYMPAQPSKTISNSGKLCGKPARTNSHGGVCKM